METEKITAETLIEAYNKLPAESQEKVLLAISSVDQEK